MKRVVRRRIRSPRGSGELLAEEIIEAATDLLLESGDETSVSIRAVATRVGVTPPSIYLHFADKNELVDAVCARYFEQLDGAIAAASDDIDDPLERALQQGLAYVRFAVDTPVLYRLSFSAIPDCNHPSKVDEVLAASAFQRISGTVAELIDRGVVPRTDLIPLVMELWAAAHGIASLMISKPGLPWGEDFTTAENLLRAVCRGTVVGYGVGYGVGYDVAE